MSLVKILIHTALCVGFLLNCPLLHAAPPDPPSEVIAVPRYTTPITVVVKWQDNSSNEENFEIHRREDGDASYSFVGSVGSNEEEFEDLTADLGTYYEYQVRARHATEGNSAWVATNNRTSPRRVWPLKDGDHDILHNFGTPITASSQYLHEGVDISSSTKEVVAGHGGQLLDVWADGKNDGFKMELDMGAGVTEPEYGYNHLHFDSTLSRGDVLAPGDLLGTVSDDAFSRDTEADHVHWGSTQQNILKFQTLTNDRDPNNQAPRVADINNDGLDFIVVSAASNDHTSPREPAWGDVDFLVDAYDDMADNLNLNVAPYSLGYWIQAGNAAGSNVRNAAAPYKLVEFDFPLYTSTGRPSDNGIVYWGLDADIDGINTWQSHLTWVLTNSRDVTGAYADIDSGQFWKTDLRSGTATQPNGSDGSPAREIQEAAFPDGKYFVHVLLEDYEHTTDAVREVTVDNFRPYVQRLQVFSGVTMVYTSEWNWDPGTAQLIVHPETFNSAAVFPASRTRDLNIEIEFSEPMSDARINSISPLGTTPTLTSDQPEHQQTIWKGRISHLDISDDGSDDGNHTFTIAGEDLAGNALLQLTDRMPLAANHSNRNAAGSLNGASGNDAIHGFTIGTIQGLQAITAIFVKTAEDDPPTPSTTDKAAELQTWLNDYYGEVAYDHISFQVAGTDWYRLSRNLDWYYTTPRTPLVDMVQEAIDLAGSNGVDLSSSDYILVVTDETTARDEWSTNGAWPYTVDGSVKPIAAGVLSLASAAPRVTNLAGRMVGLMDLFAYPEVTTPRPFVGPWSHMSEKNSQVHVMGWEKWQVGWMDEAGLATGVEVERIAKPPIDAPIANRDFTLSPLDEDSDEVKLVAIEIGEGLHYTAEYRRNNGLDSSLPDEGIIIAKTNDLVAQGEGPVIIVESDVSAGDLDDAPFTAAAPRTIFDDIGSGVNIEVMSITADEAQIRLNYAIPPFENDLFVTPHDNRWKTVDIWVDAPDTSGTFAADPRSVITDNEKPVVGHVNKVIGRVRNLGAADATNFEVELEILDPWGTDGSWRSLKVDTVPLLQGTSTNPGDDYLIIADWIPATDDHACIKLRIRGVSNDINLENNRTQENVTEFTTTPGSPYHPVISRFQVKNTFTEKLPFFFRLDGLPDGWSYIINPARPIIQPGDTIMAQVILQPQDGAPLCSRQEITLQAFAPRIDTLKRVGGITLAVSLKNDASINHESWTDCSCVCPKQKNKECHIYTQACTDPLLPNTRVAVIYTGPDDTTRVQYVTTDERGCFSDVLHTDFQAGQWETTVVLEETECRDEAISGPEVIVVTQPEPVIPDECKEYMMALLELTKKLQDRMERKDDDAVKKIYDQIMEVLEKAQECDPVFNSLIYLFRQAMELYFAGDEDKLGPLFEEIIKVLNR